MSTPLLCDVADSQVVVIDIQGRLAGAMSEAARERVIRNAGVLGQAAGLLDIPLVATEQYPKGLGPTEEALATQLPERCTILEKTCFACSGAEAFTELLKSNRRSQVVLTGMESHVCVLQTALSLLSQGYSVFVVEDAVCSRSDENHSNAIERMRAAGVVITNTESVVFEWLRDARHEHFKSISALIK